MGMSGMTRRWLILGFLWSGVVLFTWLSAVQLFIAMLAPTGWWQWPLLRRVQVVKVWKDPQNLFTDQVLVLQGAEQKVLRMSKAEAADLVPDEEVWVLDNRRTTALRPAQYRVGPLRLVLEFPEPLLLLFLGGVALSLRRSLEPGGPPPDRPRVRITDDLHLQAERRAAARK